MTTPAEDLALMGDQKETFDVLGFKIVIKTLDSDQEASATAAASFFDSETRKRVLKIEKLARAIETINGIGFSATPEEVAKGISPTKKARDILYKWHGPVVDRVHDALETLEKKREAAIAAIEKNVTSPLTSSGAGK